VTECRSEARTTARGAEAGSRVWLAGGQRGGCWMRCCCTLCAWRVLTTGEVQRMRAWQGASSGESRARNREVAGTLL
jgi:hypothetical protein